MFKGVRFWISAASVRVAGLNFGPLLANSRTGWAKSLGSLSNDDGGGNENGKKAIGTFFWPSLHGYNVKVPRFTFCRRHERKTTTFVFFS